MMALVTSPTSTYYYIPLQPPLLHVNYLKVFVASKGHNVVSTTKIRVNRMAKRLEGNIGKYALGEYRGVDPWGFIPWPRYNFLTSKGRKGFLFIKNIIKSHLLFMLLYCNRVMRM
jgi:hypothetical protein